MSSGKKRNRNITSLPIPLEHDESLTSNKHSLDHYLGDDLTTNEPKTAINSLSTNTSELEDLGIKISGLSSSSSLSWSEEYEAEITKKVQLELEKLDRTFQGIESDPSPYDLDEIAEWKRRFPHLYILGHNTPTNSAENSDVSTSSDEDISITPIHHFTSRPSVFPGNRSSLMNKKWPDWTALETPNHARNYNSLPRKPRSLEIDKYLKISSIKSPYLGKPKQTAPAAKQEARELPAGDTSPEYTSLPFLTTTPLKTQLRKRQDRNKAPKMLILPPISDTFRSISATPRQASSKSMFVSLDSSKKRSQAARLKSDLMKLFEHLPISNR